MFRIDTDGAVGGLFSDGDPALGLPATVMSDDWLNAVQEEICNLIEAAGVPLNKASNAQLVAALAASAPAWSNIALDAIHWSGWVKYRKDLLGVVWVKGQVTCTLAGFPVTNSVSFLPAGYRPDPNDLVVFAVRARTAPNTKTGSLQVNGVSDAIIIDGIADGGMYDFNFCYRPEA